MITAIAVMQALTLLILLAYAIWQWRYRFDVGRVADVMAADLMERYRDDLHTLSQKGVRDFARNRYLQLAATFGLPSGLVDVVCDRVAKTIADAQGDEPQRVEGVAIYE